MTVHQFLDYRSFRDAAVVGALEHICQALEPSPTQIDEARLKYETVGNWLAGSTDTGLQRLSIYLQGSTALGTVVRPLAGNEFDVDLVSKIGGNENRSPSEIKRLVGDRLKENERYRQILIEKPRCWRLNYANEFHLDLTPSIRNPLCSNGGELVPDRKLQCWKASNPKGYRALFEQRAALQPNFRLQKFDQATARADMEPYPNAPRFKSPLCRIVQIEKRHRDVYFEPIGCEFAPISILITTLAMQAYEYCIRHQAFDSELDLLMAVIRKMPDFIEREAQGAEIRWFVWNETTQGENFAEKWNEEPRLPQAFFAWHAKLVEDLEQLGEMEGLDGLGRSLKKSFGDGPTDRAIAAVTDEVSNARRDKTLVAIPKVGLAAMAVGPALAGATAVQANTFHGSAA
jgi:hypothetical protein